LIRTSPVAISGTSSLNNCTTVSVSSLDMDTSTGSGLSQMDAPEAAAATPVVFAEILAPRNGEIGAGIPPRVVAPVHLGARGCLPSPRPEQPAGPATGAAPPPRASTPARPSRAASNSVAGSAMTVPATAHAWTPTSVSRPRSRGRVWVPGQVPPAATRWTEPPFGAGGGCWSRQHPPQLSGF
jgi:hypothetical protein